VGESEGEVSEIKRVEVGSAVEKWESAADIRIASRHMQAVRWGAAAPSFQLGGRSARSRRKERQRDDVLLVACALSSLATRLRIESTTAAVRQCECSACWCCVILCMELQCISLQLMGRLFSINSHCIPDNAGWTFVDMCLEQLAPAAGGTQIVVTTKELVFDPPVQARVLPCLHQSHAEQG